MERKAAGTYGGAAVGLGESLGPGEAFRRPGTTVDRAKDPAQGDGTFTPAGLQAAKVFTRAEVLLVINAQMATTGPGSGAMALNHLRIVFERIE
jgi:hypothetical protein